MRRPTQAVIGYLNAFWSGDMETARSFVAESFSFAGPFLQVVGKDARSWFGSANEPLAVSSKKNEPALFSSLRFTDVAYLREGRAENIFLIFCAIFQGILFSSMARSGGFCSRAPGSFKLTGGPCRLESPDN